MFEDTAMKFWNANLSKMTEYIPGEQPADIASFVKLNTNESPFPPTPPVQAALKDACNGNLRLYPNPDADELRDEFARKLGDGFTRSNIFVANGSDEIFTLLFRGFIEKDGLAAFSYPSYSLYYTMAEANSIPFEKIPSSADFTIDLAPFAKKNYNLIILCSPNNPTGRTIPDADIAALAGKSKALIVVDEAYGDFYGESAVDLVRRFDNIIVTRSFSKSYSLAGLRVGIAIANPDIIRGFLKIKDSYNVNRLSQAGALAALKDEKGFRYNVQMIRNNKEYLEERLTELGFEIIPSKANFLFVRHPQAPAATLYQELKERKILIRHFKGAMQEDYIRITVGSMMEVKKVAESLSEILS
jgi:histidinol-phosphate aminotransferase